MLKVFSDESILSFNIEVVFKDNMGNVEKGTGGGLIREAFSLFWNEVYDSWMLGVEERIPFIRHDYQRVQWEAVGRILVAGYQSCPSTFHCNCPKNGKSLKNASKVKLKKMTIHYSNC